MASSLTSTDQVIYKTTVVLATSKDFHNWLFLVKDAALNTRVWSYINPDLTKDELLKNSPPTKPSPKEIQPAQLDASGVVQRDAAASVRDLDRDHLAVYNIELSLYRDELQEFNQIRKALAEISTYIGRTIHVRHIPHIQDLTEPYDRLKALSKHLCPTDASRKREIAAEYNRVKLWEGRGDVDKWLEEWQNAYALAKKLDLPEVYGNRAQEDFVLAIKQIHPEFAGAVEFDLSQRELKNEDFPTVEDLLAGFTNFHRKAGVPKTVNFDYSGHATNLNQEADGTPSQHSDDEASQRSSTLSSPSSSRPATPIKDKADQQLLIAHEKSSLLTQDDCTTSREPRL